MAPKRIALFCCVLSAFHPGGRVWAQNTFGKVPQSNIVSFANIGADQTAAHKVNDAIYQGIGFSNTYMVTTPEGNVIIDTSAINRAPRHKELLTAVSDAPVRYIIITHGHGDHTGGVYLWKGDDTEIITQKNFPKFCAYQDRLAPYFARSNAAQFNFDEKRLVELARSPRSKVAPTIAFDDRYDFELGGVQFEAFATPGETPDALSVWVPKYQAAFVGDLMYDSFPNIYTLRGTTPRWALDYVESLNKVLALEPEILLPSHGMPIVGKEKVKAAVTKYRDAIQYVHDETVQGMNDGKDVTTLMREIELPPELDVGESYGKVSWSVRGIYDGYVGWFDRNPATMYGRSSNVADAELVELAGGAAAVANKSQSVTEAGDPVKGLRMADAALAFDSANQAALKAKLLALKTLQSQTRNGLEHAWLGYGIRGVEKALGESSAGKSSQTR
jgi:alkyl sulfatase BDS1-like metallo-beta-lactamase superfamily hydrolase